MRASHNPHATLSIYNDVGRAAGRSGNLDFVRAYAAVSSLFVHGFKPVFGSRRTYAFEGRLFTLYGASDVFFHLAVLTRRRGSRDWSPLRT